jgi:acyl-CoA thioesterase FadM
MPVSMPIHVPRHAFSTREVARPGDLWRACQEVALLGSTAHGWPPTRYRSEGCAFIVRRMVMRHDGELRYGEGLVAETWVRTFERGLISHREIALRSTDGRDVARSSQEWVHVRFESSTAGISLRPARASGELVSAFVIEDHDAPPSMPSVARSSQGPAFTMTLPLRFVEMDPLGHLNHPAYVDLADEHVSALLHQHGVDPSKMSAAAEHVTFRTGLIAPGPVRLETRCVGTTGEGEHVLSVRMFDTSERLAAEVTLVRRLVGDPAALGLALGAT